MKINDLNVTESDLIISLINSFFFVDYGFINKVNPDNTINVTHAKKTVLTNGKELKETLTNNVEVLTIAGESFSINWELKAGDRVLLFGLKDFIPQVEDVKKAEVPKSYIHYSRANIKALPLCIFNSEAKSKIEVKNGQMTISNEDDFNINSKNVVVKTDNKIELNGNSKQFVTWAELNTELQKLWMLITTHVHPTTSPGSPTGTSSSLTGQVLDISAAKTQTVVTGG